MFVFAAYLQILINPIICPQFPTDKFLKLLLKDSGFFLNSEVFYFSVPKSKKGNEIWTFLKMSKNENPKKVLKICFAKSDLLA
jgi:hypothetical protein